MKVCFDRSGLRDMERREEILSLLEDTLEAISPHRIVEKAIHREGDRLVVGERIYSLADRRVFLLGVGKASAALASEMEQLLGGYLTAGVVVTRYGYAVPTRKISVYEGGHPLPDENGLSGARALAALAGEVGEADLVLCLISGGGSALLPLPAEGMDLSDLQAVTHLLLHCGAPIGEINTVRRHLSLLQGGQLLRRLHPAQTVTLILSDVIDDALEAIASGPTVPDPTTFRDARAVLERFSLWKKIPASVRRHITTGVSGSIPDTPKPDDPLFEGVQSTLLADNGTGREALRRAAEERGFVVRPFPRAVTGEAREAGRSLAAVGRTLAETGPERSAAAGGGETTVTLAKGGEGGRNQEVALSAAIALEGVANVMVVTLATDGTDGPTDAAGAIIDGETVRRARTLGFDPGRALDRHDAYPLFRRVGDLLFTGPTRTNVADLFLVIRTSV